MTKLIGVIDAGIGNVASISRALEDVGASVELIRSPADVRFQDGFVLPGVGAFDYGVKMLQSKGLWQEIIDIVGDEQRRLLGICLGMQLLAEGSQEGKSPGLGFIPGYVHHLSEISDFPNNLNIPNMGWGYVVDSQNAGKKFSEYFSERQRFYFVHSYYFKVSSPESQILHLEGVPSITAAVKKDNVCGFQFHPEKSHRFGKTALKWWIEEVVGC